MNGGKTGQNYQVSVIGQDGAEKVYPGMSDTVVVKPGSSVRVVTTGGGGWGDPLAREADKVVYDLQCGLISEESARENYGVAVSLNGRKWSHDATKTQALREKLRKERGTPPMFDRGEAFRAMKAKGMVHYPENWTDPDEGWTAVGEDASFAQAAE